MFSRNEKQDVDRMSSKAHTNYFFKRHVYKPLSDVVHSPSLFMSHRNAPLSSRIALGVIFAPIWVPAVALSLNRDCVGYCGDSCFGVCGCSGERCM